MFYQVPSASAPDVDTARGHKRGAGRFVPRPVACYMIGSSGSPKVIVKGGVGLALSSVTVT